MKNFYSDGFFSVDIKNGFLPVKDPLNELPEKYGDLQNLIIKLSEIIKQKDKILDEVNLINNHKDKVIEETDIFIIQSLYRAYSFITSAYLLEPSYQEFLETGDYGKARNVLPRNISEPYHIVAEKLNSKMWLDYHYAYSLGNYVKIDDLGTLDWRNLGMACSFSGGTDEIGFIMVHVYINELSPRLIKGIYNILNSKKDKDSNNLINNELQELINTMKEINKRRREMWQASRHEHYNDFRIFIMGVKGNNTIFGEGVTYEGVTEGPVAYRGQTGAQDDIIPTMDIFTGVINYYPDNDLTKYLYELREYRPVCVQEFFNDLRKEMSSFGEKGLFNLLENNDNIEGMILLVELIEEIYHFRNGHWQFVQKYIMANTRYAFATGGTPITTWLINQIEACLYSQKRILECLSLKENVDNVRLSELYNNLKNKRNLLEKQVEELSKNNYNIKLIHNFNIEMNLDDEKSFA